MLVGHHTTAILVIMFATGLRVRSEVDINTVLPKGYQKGQRPRLPGPPVDVQVNLYVNSFGNIEEAKMEYKLYGYFRQFWNDQRLAGRHNDSIVLKGEDITKIWKPDPYCYNARESTLSASDTDINSLMIIQPNGNIIYSRMTIILAECDMDLRHFPMDLQNCYLKFSSYSYSTDHIKMSWKGGNPVTVARTNLAQFYFTELDTKTFTESYALGNYSIIEVHFRFKRRLGYFLIQVYAPDIFVVMLSWIVFWMDRNDMGNRMALGITTILTIMFLMGSINAAMPRVSYPKALDWYLMISFTLVFLSLIECTLVFVLSTLENEAKEEGSTKEEEEEPSENEPEKEERDIKECDKRCSHRILWITDNPKYCMRDGAELLELHSRRTSGPSPILAMPRLCSIKHGSTEHEFVMPHLCTSRRSVNKRKLQIPNAVRNFFKRCKNLQGIDQVVDTASKVIFPSVFLLFNIVYWSIYLSKF